MPQYVVFDRQTGKIVHTHFAPEGVDASTEDILSNVGQEFDRRSLDITTGEHVTEGRGYRVDPEARQIVASEDADSQDAGGATGMGLEASLRRRPVQVRYEGRLQSDSSKD